MEHILGNEEMKQHFITAIRQGKVSHAYILEGEKGSGKKRMAYAFAKMLMCEQMKDHPKEHPEEERPWNTGLRACGKCTACIMMENKDHPDVIRVTHEKPGVISVLEIREQVVNTVDVMPYKGPYKIYIIDEAEKMNIPAQNAILKTIEEPPGYAVLLLLTANRGAFLPTILSRCILLSMKPLPLETVKKYLIRECGADAAEADFLAGFAMGNIGKAKEAAVSEEFAQLRACGVSLLQSIHERKDHEIISSVKELLKWKNRIDDYLNIMLIWFRDILVMKSLGDEKKLIFKGEYTFLSRQSRLLAYEDINEIILKTGRTRLRIGANVNPDAALEMLHIDIKNRCRKR